MSLLETSSISSSDEDEEANLNQLCCLSFRGFPQKLPPILKLHPNYFQIILIIRTPMYTKISLCSVWRSPYYHAGILGSAP